MVGFLEKMFAGEEYGEASRDDREAAALLIEGVGGAENVAKVWNCFTRLRFNLKDTSLIQEEILRRVPSSGMIQHGKTVQVVFGMRVKLMRKVVDDYMASL